MNRTYDLKVMSLASYHCSTPRYENGNYEPLLRARLLLFDRKMVPMSGLEPPTSGL